MSTLAGAVLAHQGGWDEVLLVLAPLAVFAWLLLLANRRASRISDGSSSGGGGEHDHHHDHDHGHGFFGWAEGDGGEDGGGDGGGD